MSNTTILVFCIGSAILGIAIFVWNAIDSLRRKRREKNRKTVNNKAALQILFNYAKAHVTNSLDINAYYGSQLIWQARIYVSTKILVDALEVELDLTEFWNKLQEDIAHLEGKYRNSSTARSDLAEVNRILQVVENK